MSPSVERGEKVLVTVVIGALLLVGGGVALVSLLPLGMASGTCGSSRSGLVCTTYGAIVVMFLPLVGVALGVVTSLVALAQGRPPLRWAGVGWAVFAVLLVTAYVIALG